MQSFSSAVCLRACCLQLNALHRRLPAGHNRDDVMVMRTRRKSRIWCERQIAKNKRLIKERVRFCLTVQPGEDTAALDGVDRGIVKPEFYEHKCIVAEDFDIASLIKNIYGQDGRVIGRGIPRRAFHQRVLRFAMGCDPSIAERGSWVDMHAPEIRTILRAWVLEIEF